MSIVPSYYVFCKQEGIKSRAKRPVASRILIYKAIPHALNQNMGDTARLFLLIVIQMVMQHIAVNPPFEKQFDHTHQGKLVWFVYNQSLV